MRKRNIRKIGNSFYVKLEQIDLKDWGLNNQDSVLVGPIAELQESLQNLE